MNKLFAILTLLTSISAFAVVPEHYSCEGSNVAKPFVLLKQGRELLISANINSRQWIAMPHVTIYGGSEQENEIGYDVFSTYKVSPALLSPEVHAIILPMSMARGAKQGVVTLATYNRVTDPAGRPTHNTNYDYVVRRTEVSCKFVPTRF